MNSLDKLLNENRKEKGIFTRNYFFAGTLAVILINVLLFDYDPKRVDPFGGWYSVLNFDMLLRVFVNSFRHANTQHLLLNMLCFFVCGLYFERKIGSIPMLLLLAAMAFFTSTATTANYVSVYWAGFSGVNFGLYAYIIIDYLVHIPSDRKNAFKMISGGVMLALIYLAMCFCGGTTAFGFKWYPYDLINNMGHYTSFVAGAIFCGVVQIVRLITQKRAKRACALKTNNI